MQVKIIIGDVGSCNDADLSYDDYFVIDGYRVTPCNAVLDYSAEVYLFSNLSRMMDRKLPRIRASAPYLQLHRITPLMTLAISKGYEVDLLISYFKRDPESNALLRNIREALLSNIKIFRGKVWVHEQN